MPLMSNSAPRHTGRVVPVYVNLFMSEPLERTIIPHHDFRQAAVEDVVAFIRWQYLEHRHPDDPDLRFEVEPQVKSVTLVDPMKYDGSTLLGEGDTATASLVEEMKRAAELANLFIVIDGQTVTFRGKTEDGQQQMLPIAAIAAQADLQRSHRQSGVQRISGKILEIRVVNS